MRVLSESPFDYITLSSCLSSLILMMAQVVAQQFRLISPAAPAPLRAAHCMRSGWCSG